MFEQDQPADINIEFKKQTSATRVAASKGVSPANKAAKMNVKAATQAESGKSQNYTLQQRRSKSIVGKSSRSRANMAAHSLKIDTKVPSLASDSQYILESPRSAFIRHKFKQDDQKEVVLENYNCAARMNILLQGVLYVTNRAVYFYSPFNNKTIFGHGTKIKIPYKAVRLVKKESTLLIFPNAIRFVLASREEIVFASFVSRDTCYSLVLRQLAIANHSKVAIESLQDKSTVKSRALDAKKMSLQGEVEENLPSTLKQQNSEKIKAKIDPKLDNLGQMRTALPEGANMSSKLSKSQRLPASSKAKNPLQNSGLLIEESKLGASDQHKAAKDDKNAGMPLEDFITVGEDYIEISRAGDDVANSAFDPDVNKSVIESDYSDREDETQQQNAPTVAVNRGFMKGCYVPQSIEDDLDYQEVVARRMEAAKQDIPDYNDFEWDLYKQDFPGIPLKHLLDNFLRFGAVGHDSDCPTTSHPAFMNQFMWPRCSNQVERHEPQVCPPYPKVWNNWHDELDIEKLRSMPLKTYFEQDVTNYVKDPSPMQPKSTKNLQSYSTYLVGPNKAVAFMHSKGREFMFSDRFAIEFFFEFTQKVDVGVEREQDPARALQMFTTELQVRGRIKILKSLALLKGKIVAEAKKQCSKIYDEPIQGMDVIVAQTLKQRLQHFLEPGYQNILNREPSVASIHPSEPSTILDQSAVQVPVEAGHIQSQFCAGQAQERSLQAESNAQVAALQEQVRILKYAVLALLAFVVLSVVREPFFACLQFAWSIKYSEYLPSVQISAPKQSLFSSGPTPTPAPSSSSEQLSSPNQRIDRSSQIGERPGEEHEPTIPKNSNTLQADMTKEGQEATQQKDSPTGDDL